mgnify:CR=1 FL=1
MEPCENAIKIEHDDPKMIQKFVKSFNENKVCETFVPEPDYSKVPVYRDSDISKPVDPKGAWYEWRYQNWGIKCDFGREDNDVIDVDSESTEVTVWFDTPDVPPIELYEYLTEELGFRIHVEYYEFAGDYFGVFDNVLFKNEEKKYFADIINLKTLLKSKSYIPDIYDMLKDQLEDLMGDEEDEEQRKLYRGE